MQLQNRHIELKNISLSYDNRVVLRDINLTLNRGDFMLVTGANGGGKTSLIRVMLGLQKPSIGRVLYYDSGVAKNYLKDVKSERVGYLPQKNSLDMRFPISVREVIESGLVKMRRELTKEECRNKVSEMLQYMQLDLLQDRQIGEVSGGQFQRALFARTIISNPTLLVLDEPTSYLDREYTQKIYTILQQSLPQTSIVMVSHDTHQVIDMANRIIEVDRGCVIEKS